MEAEKLDVAKIRANLRRRGFRPLVNNYRGTHIYLERDGRETRRLSAQDAKVLGEWLQEVALEVELKQNSWLQTQAKRRVELQAGMQLEMPAIETGTEVSGGIER